MYDIKDHLGNVRLVHDDSEQAKIYQGNYYSAFGVSILSLGDNMTPTQTVLSNDRLYNGKELQDGTNWLDYGARMYYPELGRWMAIDPLAIKFHSENTYSYCGNNPINNVDPDGKAYYYSSDGTYLGSDGKDNEDVYSVTKYRHDKESNTNRFATKDATKLVDNNGTAYTLNQFLKLAGTVMGEMDRKHYDIFEARSIFSTIENRAKALNTSELDIAENTGIYGWDIKDNISEKEFTKKAKVALAGTMDAINSKTDYSNGAFFWQGRDLRAPMKGSHAYESYYLSGLNFKDSNHDFWNLGNKKSGKSDYDYLYETTAFFGRTTFMRYTEEYKKANKKTKDYK